MKRLVVVMFLVTLALTSCNNTLNIVTPSEEANKASPTMETEPKIPHTDYIREALYNDPSIQKYMQLHNRESFDIRPFENGFEVYIDGTLESNITVYLENNEIKFNYHFNLEHQFDYEEDMKHKKSKIVWKVINDSEHLYEFKPYEFIITLDYEDKEMELYNHIIYHNGEAVNLHLDVKDVVNTVFYKNDEKIIDDLFAIRLYEMAKHVFDMQDETEVFKYIIPQIDIDNEYLTTYELEDDFLFFNKEYKWGISDEDQKILSDEYSYTMPYTLINSEIVFEKTAYGEFEYDGYYIGGFEHGFTDGNLLYYKDDIVLCVSDDGGSYIEQFDYEAFEIDDLAGCGKIDKDIDFEDMSYMPEVLYSYAVVNGNGELITEFEYDYVLNTDGKVIPVMKHGLWGYVNNNGEEIIPVEYQAVLNIKFGECIPYPENDGYIVLKNKEGKFGVMDIYGKLVKEFIYDWGLPYKEGYLLKDSSGWQYFK